MSTTRKDTRTTATHINNFITSEKRTKEKKQKRRKAPKKTRKLQQ